MALTFVLDAIIFTSLNWYIFNDCPVGAGSPRPCVSCICVYSRDGKPVPYRCLVVFHTPSTMLSYRISKNPSKTINANPLILPRILCFSCESSAFTVIYLLILRIIHNWKRISNIKNTPFPERVIKSGNHNISAFFDKTLQINRVASGTAIL